MGIAKAWEAGYTGEGVVITFVDDGMEYDHPDLAANYVSTFAFKCTRYVKLCIVFLKHV